jgi:predicted AAA+ superfamily ATPase
MAASADCSRIVRQIAHEICGRTLRRDPGRRRERFFDSYITDLVSRDVRQISDIGRPAAMRRLLNMVAARMATMAAVQPMASDIGIPRPTLSRYLDLLELVFVIRRVPAWSSNLTTRAVATPKLIMTDTGRGGRLTGFSLDRAKDPTAPAGQLLENFVIGEIARQLTWCEEPVQLFHYRDRDTKWMSSLSMQRVKSWRWRLRRRRQCELRTSEGCGISPLAWAAVSRRA